METSIMFVELINNFGLLVVNIAFLVVISSMLSS